MAFASIHVLKPAQNSGDRAVDFTRGGEILVAAFMQPSRSSRELISELKF
jgi:hypothetical protein